MVKAQGNGQSECYQCKKNGKYSLTRKEVLILSKVSSKINRIKKKLDNISGLEDDFIISNINKLDLFVDLMINDINNYLKENPLNGTIFKNRG